MKLEGYCVQLVRKWYLLYASRICCCVAVGETPKILSFAFSQEHVKLLEFHENLQ